MTDINGVSDTQAGAQVDEKALRNRQEMFGAKAGGYIFRLESKLSTAESDLISAREGENILAKKLVTAQNTIERISNYALEAQKAPITREDMHDHLKAQAFYDEAQGLYRLVLSEPSPLGTPGRKP